MGRSNDTPYCCWVVTVFNVTAPLGDEEPQHYGPWSRSQADRIACELEHRFDAAIYQDVYSVTVWPLRRLSVAAIAREHLEAVA